jgi:hypothetical protein
MIPGIHCVTAAERQIRDLGGETRDYYPHGAISALSHITQTLPALPTG